MDSIFQIRTLTTAINEMPAANMVVYNRLFRGKEHMEPSDRLAFEIITGSEKLLKNISIYAPATVDDKTGRRIVTLQAPRLADKRFIHTAELNSLRAYGSQVGLEMMSARVAREQLDMKRKHDRTLEFWACNALKGKIYDTDMTTELVDYGMDADHLVTLTGTDLWSNASSNPINKIREWKRLIKDDSKAAISGFVMFLGYSAMDNLLKNSAVLDLLKYGKGTKIAEDEDVARLAKTELIEYDGSFISDSNERTRFIGAEYVILVGMTDDVVDVPYAPVIDDDAPNGVGNVDINGNGMMFFSKSWTEKDPSGRWIKAESRPLPVLQRPGCVVYAKVV